MPETEQYELSFVESVYQTIDSDTNTPSRKIYPNKFFTPKAVSTGFSFNRKSRASACSIIFLGIVFKSFLNGGVTRI
jgi:hypothetical protein